MIRRSEPRLIDSYDSLLLDLDGTLMHGGEPIEHAGEAVDRAREAGLHLAFVTNNASRSAQQASDHLAGVGVHAEPTEMITAAQVAAHTLAERLASGSAVLVIGGDALAGEIASVGLTPVNSDGPDVAAVVQGWAPTLTWPLLAEGAYAINRGAAWLATNLDATLPTERGYAPGNGSMVAALRHATGAEPESTGKPAPGMFLIAAERIGSRRPLVVGDRLDTDIAGANSAQMDSLLVLTGVSTAQDAIRATPQERPTWVLDDLSGIWTPLARPVVDGDRARCGTVSAIWGNGDITINGPIDDTSVICAVLALLRTYSPHSAWTGTIRNADGSQEPTQP